MCMKDRLMTFIDKHSILSDSQFGFRDGKSTSDALAKFTDIVFGSINNSLIVETTTKI